MALARAVPFFIALFLWACPAHAQLRGLPGGLGSGLGGALGAPGTGILQGTIGPLTRTTTGLTQSVGNDLDAIGRDAVGRPLQAPRPARDPLGAPIVKNQVVAIAPSEQSLEIARRLNFEVVRQDNLEGLGLNSVTLQVPDGMSEANALAALRSADPAGSYDYDHIYNPSGSHVGALAAATEILPMDANAVRVGMIDGGINAHHAALTDQDIVAQNFAGSGNSPATQHGTAIASLLVGHDGTFTGYLPGAKLYAADVFGGAADGGSAVDIARALNWLASAKISVTNISLAGPPNALLEAAVKAFVSGGHVLVAAVGNDGPAAPANYPAAYSDVIGVTSVDSHNQLEIDANHAAVKFAARGVDIRAANLARGYATFTGTSYAAPAVTARFALLMNRPDRTTAQDVLTQLSADAAPLPNIGPYLDPPGAPPTAAR